MVGQAPARADVLRQTCCDRGVHAAGDLGAQQVDMRAGRGLRAAPNGNYFQRAGRHDPLVLVGADINSGCDNARLAVQIAAPDHPALIGTGIDAGRRKRQPEVAIGVVGQQGVVREVARAGGEGGRAGVVVSTSGPVRRRIRVDDRVVRDRVERNPAAARGAIAHHRAVVQPASASRIPARSPGCCAGLIVSDQAVIVVAVPHPAPVCRNRRPRRVADERAVERRAANSPAAASPGGVADKCAPVDRGRRVHQGVADPASPVRGVVEEQGVVCRTHAAQAAATIRQCVADEDAIGDHAPCFAERPRAG